MSKPVRIVISRLRGSNLQGLSLRTNGRAAVNVTRPSKWGNPFTVAEAGSQREAVELFRTVRCNDALWKEQARDELRGKNLACYCRPEQECHADVLLEIANR